MPTIPRKFRFIGDETPSKIWWVVNGSLINLSSGYTFLARLIRSDDETETLIWEKTSGFTGDIGSGTQSSGMPNLIITWSVSEDWNNASLEPGLYELQIKATKVSDNSEEKMKILYELGRSLW